MPSLFRRTIKKPFFSKPYQLFLIEAFLFSSTLVLGIITAGRSYQILINQEIKIPQLSPWRFLVNFIFATLLIIVIRHFLRLREQKTLVYKLLFSFSILTGGVLVFNAWITALPSLVLMISLIVWWWRYPSVFIQDLCIILGMAGVGSVVGLAMSPLTVVVFLIIFSVYDFIAVYKTKHMVEMAKEMIRSRAILGLVVPSSLQEFRAPLKEVRPGGKFLVVGGGDIVFPLLLCCSLLPSQDVLASFVVAFFSLLGLGISFFLFLSQEKKKALPALPPIAFFSITGFLIAKFLNLTG